MEQSDVERQRQNGMLIWALGALAAAIYDYYAIRTRKTEALSSAVWRWRDGPWGSAFWGVLVGLLYHFTLEGENGLIGRRYSEGSIRK